jgi:hypothetical protein
LLFINLFIPILDYFSNIKMTTLPSQQLDAPKTKKNLPLLEGSTNSAEFFRAVNLHCLTAHGLIGQDVIKGRPTIPEELGPPPHYSDQRLHPFTGNPIPDSRQFSRVEATKAQLADADFDPNELPLTPDGERRLDSALAARPQTELLGHHQSRTQNQRRRSPACDHDGHHPSRPKPVPNLPRIPSLACLAI